MKYIAERLNRIIVSFFILLISPILSAQTDSTKAVNYSDSTENITFEKVEVEATFSGGEKAWRSFLERTLNAAVPVYNRAPAGSYTIVIQFVVDKNGSSYQAWLWDGEGSNPGIEKISKMDACNARRTKSKCLPQTTGNIFYF